MNSTFPSPVAVTETTPSAPGRKRPSLHAAKGRNPLSDPKRPRSGMKISMLSYTFYALHSPAPGAEAHTKPSPGKPVAAR